MAAVLVVALVALVGYGYRLVTRRRDEGSDIRAAPAVLEPPAPYGGHDGGPTSGVDGVLSGLELPEGWTVAAEPGDGERRADDNAGGRRQRVVFVRAGGTSDAAGRVLGAAVALTGTSVEWLTPHDAVLSRDGSRAVMVVHPEAARALLGAGRPMFPGVPPSSTVVEVRST